jgi:hypothetical protein
VFHVDLLASQMLLSELLYGPGVHVAFMVQVDHLEYFLPVSGQQGQAGK